MSISGNWRQSSKAGTALRSVWPVGHTRGGGIAWGKGGWVSREEKAAKPPLPSAAARATLVFFL